MKYFAVSFGEKRVIKTMSMNSDLTLSRQSPEQYRIMELGNIPIKVKWL